MKRQVRIGILGLSHDHVWDFVAHRASVSGVEFVAAGDPDPVLRAKAAANGITTTVSDPADIIARNDIDAVAIFADNRSSVDLGIAAAQRGLHVFVEKPIAADYAGAVALHRATQRAGVTLMVTWPIAWWPNIQYACQLIDANIQRGYPTNIYLSDIAMNPALKVNDQCFSSASKCFGRLDET